MAGVSLSTAGETVHLPSLPPGYDVAIEQCSVVGGGRSVPPRDNMTGGQPSSAQTTVDANEVRGHNIAKPPSLVVTGESEEHRAATVLHESRWLMEEPLSIDDAESLLRACGSDGSFVIAGTSFPNVYTLYCRRVSGDATVDSVENMRIEKTISGSFFWEGQGEFLTLSECAARFLHLNPHKHCPMFANRRVWSHFSSRFSGDVDHGFELRADLAESPEDITALHNTINQNDWFFPALSEDQAAFMLNQHGRSNCFVVSNQMQTENYIMSTRQPIFGLEQDIIEHLRIIKIMDNVFQLAGDDGFYQHLDAVVRSYREANPAMQPLFGRQAHRQDDMNSVAPSFNADDDDEQVVVPPEYNEASVLPNPEDLTRLPTVPQVHIPETDSSSNAGDEGVVTSDVPSSRSTAQRSGNGTGGRSNGARPTEKCCIIL